MRKYKQVKRKEVIFLIDEWKLIEDKAASVLMKTGTFIKRMSLDGHITYFNMFEVGEVMKALRIIGANINQIAKKANETHNIYAEDVEKLRKENEEICHMLSKTYSCKTVQMNIPLQT